MCCHRFLCKSAIYNGLGDFFCIRSELWLSHCSGVNASFVFRTSLTDDWLGFLPIPRQGKRSLPRFVAVLATIIYLLSRLRGFARFEKSVFDRDRDYVSAQPIVRPCTVNTCFERHDRHTNSASSCCGPAARRCIDWPRCLQSRTICGATVVLLPQRNLRRDVRTVVRTTIGRSYQTDRWPTHNEFHGGSRFGRGISN